MFLFLQKLRIIGKSSLIKGIFYSERGECMRSFFEQLGKRIKTYFKHVDLYLIFLSLLSSGFGLLLIYSATRSYDTNKYMIVQAGAIFLGFICYIIASLIDIDTVAKLWIWLFFANLILLASLYFLGVDGGTGNRSWIRFGPIGIQPAEVGKVIFIVTFAQHIHILHDKLNHILSVLQLCAHAMITAAFVYLFSKDLGMTLVFLFIFVIMLFAAGLKYRYFVIGGALLAAISPLIWKYFLGTFQKNRILVVFDPSIDPDTAFHALQSQIALGAGRLLGRGYLQGTQTQYNILPTKHTDFIFSVAGEEFGFLGCMIIIALLSLLILRIFYVSYKATSDVSNLVCIGIGGMLLFQTFINIGMCLGIMPVIGLTLPLYSYGGSSILTTYVALGIVAGVRMRGKPSWLQ